MALLDIQAHGRTAEDGEVGMSEFITRVGGGEYQVIFKTDSVEKYHAVEDFCRKIIDHSKLDPDRVRVVRCSDCRFWYANNAEEGDASGLCLNTNGYQVTTDMNWFCADGEREG